MFFEAQYWDANYGTPGMLDPRQTYQNVNYWILGGGKATAWNPETGKWKMIRRLSILIQVQSCRMVVQTCLMHSEQEKWLQ